MISDSRLSTSPPLHTSRASVFTLSDLWVVSNSPGFIHCQSTVPFWSSARPGICHQSKFDVLEFGTLWNLSHVEVSFRSSARSGICPKSKSDVLKFGTLWSLTCFEVWHDLKLARLIVFMARGLAISFSVLSAVLFQSAASVFIR